MTRAGLNRHAARRDANEPEIVRALEAVGATVERMKAPVDLLIAYRGRTYLLDVKTRTGRPTDAQQRFVAKWQDGGPVGFARTVEEALTFIGAMED